MAARNLAWLRDQLAFRLDFNPNQADQSFTADRLTFALNEAYDEVVNWGKANTSRLYWIRTVEFTWPAGTTTFDLRAVPALENLDIFHFQDVTEDTNRPRNLDLLWRDAYTLVWYNEAGPPNARTIRILYLAHAEDLVYDTDEPELLHPSHRHILPLQAAINLKEIADSEAPPGWYERLQNKLMAWNMEIQSRPREAVSGIQHEELHNGLEKSRYARYDLYTLS